MVRSFRDNVIMLFNEYTWLKKLGNDNPKMPWNYKLAASEHI